MKRFLQIMGLIFVLAILAQLYTKRHPEVPSYTPPTSVPKVDVHVGKK